MVFNFIDDASLVPLPTQVPNLVELSETLGFVTSGSRPNRELADSTHYWRRHYVCDDGTPGIELLDWKSSPVREKLKMMTKRYLNGSGKRERWGPNPRPEELQLQYKKDSDKVLETMMMFFWKQNEHQNRNAHYHKKVKDTEGASTPHGGRSPGPNTPGQYTFNIQSSHVNGRDLAFQSPPSAIPPTEETPMCASLARKTQGRSPPAASARTMLEKQGIHEPVAAPSHISSSHGQRPGEDTSTQVRHVTGQAAPTGRLRNKLSRSCLVTLPESSAATKDISCSNDNDVRSTIDPSKLVLKYRKMTDKSQLHADGSSAAASPSSEHRFDSASTPDLPTLQEIFKWGKPKATSLNDGQRKQNGDATEVKAHEEDQRKEVEGDDRPASAVRSNRENQSPRHEVVDETINSNKAGLDVKATEQGHAPHHNSGGCSPDDHRSSGSERHESSDFVRRSSRAKKPLVTGSDPSKGDFEIFFNGRPPWDDEEEGIIGDDVTTEPSPKRRKVTGRKKEPPQPLISKSSLRPSKTAKAYKRKLSQTKAPKKVRDETQIPDATDLSTPDHLIIDAEMSSSPYAAPVNSSPTSDDSRKESKSDEAVEKIPEEPKRRVHVSFVIVQKCNALTVKQTWPDGKLRGKSADFLFSEVSGMCKGTNIEQIRCTLFTSMTVYIEVLRRDDNEGFLRMERNFAKEISKAINTNANDGKDIEICIEPLGLEETAVKERTEVMDVEVGDW